MMTVLKKGCGVLFCTDGYMYVSEGRKVWTRSQMFGAIARRKSSHHYMSLDIIDT